MKNMSAAEFAEYIDGLEFEELEDITAYIRSYFESYKNIPEENDEEKNEAWIKYVILSSKFCMTFVHYIDMSLKYRKDLEDKLKAVDEEFGLEPEE